jgi:ribonuclease-3 family protein
MLEELYGSILDGFNFSDNNIHSLPPLVLAYVGDAVYEVFIRTFLISEGNVPVHVLHKRSINYVKAKAQSDIVHRIMADLTPEEHDVVRRGRNAKSGTIPKNADVTEYKYATGFEALVGYLYLKKDYDRLIMILKLAISGGS